VLSTRAERLLPYPAEALFDLAADLEQYPRYLAGWICARVYEREAGVCYAQQLVGFGPVRMSFRSKALMHRPERIEVSSDDSPFRRFVLLWQFEGTQPHEGCRVSLSVELELRSRLLQGWVERLGPAATLNVLFAFEQRARQLLGPPALVSS
jgi:coenzyme Q-binding protein COQ10